MTHSSEQWAQDRGERWVASLDGIEAMLAPVDSPLLAALDLDGARRVAEIGCGGGATSREILRRVQDCEVHGFDISPAAVRAAETRVPGAHFHVADAQRWSPEQPFDRLCSRFGIMFFDDPGMAFGNLCRWLAPGARVAFAVWARPDANPWMTAVRDAVDAVAPVPKPVPGQPGPFRYADESELLSLLESSGFRDVRAESWRGLLPIGGGLDADKAAGFALTAFATFAEVLREAGPEASERAHQDLRERFEPHQRKGAVEMDAHVHLVTAVS
ncbi:MAG: class I SAM-dependent methyltransferase [Myxococcota bacterium]